MTTAAWPERQQDLFLGYPNHPGRQIEMPAPETNTWAAAPKHKGVEIRDQVYRALKRQVGTTAQLATRTGLPYEAIQPRTTELKDAGLIQDSGRRGPSRCPNRTAIIWEPVRL